MLTLDAKTASSPLPLAIEINEQSGRINVKSIMFAPSMLPAEISKMARNTAPFNLWWVYLFRSQIKNRGSFSTASAKLLIFI